MVWQKGWPRGGPSIQCSSFLSSAFSVQGPPPAPTNTVSPPLRHPSLLALRQPPSLPPARPPHCLPLSISFPPPPALQDPARAGRQAGRRRPQRGERAVAVAAAVVVASSREAGPAGDTEQAAATAPCRGPGVRGQALPAEALCGRPRDTPPSSAFLFHLLLSFHPSLLPIPPPHLPLSQHLWGCQHPIPTPSPSTAQPCPAPSMLFLWGPRA
jgi:hypothetical protein